MTALERKRALLVIDMQRGLLNRDVYDKETMIANIRSLMESFHRARQPVILVRHANDTFLRKGSPDWEVSEELPSSQGDIVIDKTHGSVFREKPFLTFLKENGITSLVVAGLVSNGCIRAACLDGVRLGYELILVADGHSTFSKGGKTIVEQWNQELSGKGVTVMPCADLLS